MAAATKMERPILDVNQLGDLADYGLEEVTPEAVSAAYWDRRFPVIEGGLFDGLDISDLDEYTIEQKPWYKGAVDGVEGFLKGIHLPRWERKQGTAGAMLGLNEQPAAAEPAEAGRSRLFEWLKEIDMKAGEWWQQLSSGKREEVAPVPAVVAPAAPEGEADRFGWLKNSLKWLRGAPGGLINKFRRKDAVVAAAPQISRAERVKALREGTTQFLKDWGPEIAVGLLGGYLGYSTVSMETMVATGSLAPIAMEVGAVLTAGFGSIGLVMGDERGPDAILETEGRFGKVATAIRRGCSNKVVRRGLKLLTAGSGGFAAGGAGRLAIETFQLLAAPFPSAGGGAPAEVATGNLKNVWSPGVGTASEVADWEARRQAIGQLVQPIVPSVPAGGMTPEQLAAANAAGQEGASWAAQNAAHAADVVKQVAEAAAQAAADAAAATGSARQAAETLANTPVAEIGRNLAGGGTVWGNEIAFAQQLGIDHVVPVANAMKNFAHVFTQSQPFTGIGPESSVNLLNRDVATWLAGQLNGVIGKDPGTLDSFHKMIWEIGYAGRQANTSDLTQLAKEYASQMVP